MSGKPSAWSHWILISCTFIASAVTLTGCNSDSSESGAGSITVTRSAKGSVAGIVGKAQHYQLAFTSAGTVKLLNFNVQTGLDSLPAGWNGPATFGCASLNAATPCTLDLVFAPTSAGNGTFALGYTFQGTSGKKNASVSIDYSAVTANGVQAGVSPGGQVNAIASTGTRAVAITFNTNDGTTATDLAVTTDLSSLPSGWSSTSHTFTCSQASTGSGCQLQLSYAPTAVDSGTLVLNYQYQDDAGLPHNGSVDIDYAATSHNNLVATASPSGQISATLGAGSQAVAVTFTTDDVNPVTNVAVTSNLTSLPSGWSSTAPTFTCATASTGNGCQLSLSFAPTVIGNGTLTLAYSYNDNAGQAQLAHVDIPYISTANNNVIGSVSPTGQVVTQVGSSGSATITFTTDDGNPASSLTATTDLSALPGGWSSTSPSLHCATVNSGNGCQLTLTFAPLTGGSGTLQINYSYTNNAGSARTGSVSIPYLGKTAHAYVGQLVSVVEVCAVGGDGLLSGCADSGVVGDAVAIGGGHAYVGDYSNSIIYLCDIAADGSLSNCASTGSNYFSPFVMTVSGNILYAASANFSHTIMYCPIQSDGTVGACAETTSLNGGEGLNTANGYLYISRPHDGPNGTVSVCTQAVDGSLSACSTTGSGFSGPEDIAISGNFAFVSNTTDGTISTCAISGSDGTLSACAKSTLGSGPMGIAVYNGRAYVSSRSGNIYVCDINGTTGVLSNCVISNGGSSLGLSVQIAVH